MQFEPVILSEEERKAFVEYMGNKRGLKPSTIQTVLDYLSVTVANTRASRRKARYARAVYRDFIRETGRGVREYIEKD